MSERFLNSIRFAAPPLLALALSTSVMAQTTAAREARKPAAAKAAVGAESDPDVALARKAAIDWLALVDAGKFEATWDEAAMSFQKAQTRADWAKGLGGARPTMGKLITRTFLNHETRTNLPNLPPGKYITIRFTCVFEKHEDGAESVTLIKDGTRGFRMMSYFLK